MLECPDLLFSYSMLVGAPWLRLMCDGLWGCGPDLLIDSGGFSAYRQGEVIDLPAFSAYARSVQDAPNCWGVAQLDEPGNREGTKRNLDTMLKLGARPMPICTVDMPIAYVREVIGVNRRIALAGGLGNFKGAADWAVARYVAASELEPSGQYHGFGFVRWPRMFQAKLTSVDSSSHACGARYGSIQVFRPNTGLASWSCGAARARGLRTMPDTVRELLEVSRVQPARVFDRVWFSRGGLSIVGMLSSYAALMQWRYARTQGLTIFQAVSDVHSLARFALVAKHGRTDGRGVDIPALDKERAVWASKDQQWRTDAWLDIVRSRYLATKHRRTHGTASAAVVTETRQGRTDMEGADEQGSHSS